MTRYTLNELRSIFGENDPQVKAIELNNVYRMNPSTIAFKRVEVTK